MKKPTGWVEYCMKEDTDPFIHGDVPTPKNQKNAKTNKSDAVMKMIAEGKPPNEIRQEYPGFFLMNMKKIMEAKSFILKETLLSRPRYEVTCSCASEAPQETQDIAEWLTLNLNTPREFKQKQLYIWGKHNMGKTSLIISLEKFLSVWRIPPYEHWYCNYQDDCFDLGFIDEYKGLKPIGFMNELLQGGRMVLPQKGVSAGMEKKNNIPIIIASNEPLEEIHKNISRDALDPLLSRLLVIEVKSFIEINFTMKKKE